VRVAVHCGPRCTAVVLAKSAILQGGTVPFWGNHVTFLQPPPEPTRVRSYCSVDGAFLPYFGPASGGANFLSGRRLPRPTAQSPWRRTHNQSDPSDRGASPFRRLRGFSHRINDKRLVSLALGREASLVGRPDFKSGKGCKPVLGGFNSHSLPPRRRFSTAPSNHISKKPSPSDTTRATSAAT
jgi:hypothetical protein